MPSLYEPIQAFAFDGIAKLTESTLHIPTTKLLSTAATCALHCPLNLTKTPKQHGVFVLPWKVPASEPISADAEEENDWSPEMVQVHLYLYFDLVMSNPQLLKKLIDVRGHVTHPPPPPPPPS